MNRSSFRDGIILAVVLLVVGPLVVVGITLSFLAADRTRTARLGWDTTLGSWDEVMQRFPATEANAAALELEQHAAALGIDLAPSYLERSRALPEATGAVDQVKRHVFRYSVKQLERADRGRLDAPPTQLVDYIAAYGPELDALRRGLGRGDIPVWESDLSKLGEAPIPNLLGQIDLHKLLVSVALAQIHAGDTPAALETLAASWKLSRSLRDWPYAIVQLIYLSATRLQIGALRHVQDLPDVWTARLQEHDFRQSFVTALKVEGWVWLYGNEAAITTGPGSSLWQRMGASAGRPYATLCLAEVSEIWRERVGSLERVPTLCDQDLSAEGADLNIQVSSWNKLGGMLTPGLAGSIDRVASLELDRELLLLAIEADASRRATGAWPAPGTATLERASTACPGDRWIYTPAAGRLEIALSREIGWPGQMGAILPQRIVLD